VHYAPRDTIDVPQANVDEELRLCFYKSPEWDREREWRCVKRFEKDESRLVSFDSTVIKEIIVGHKADDPLIAQLVRAVAMTDCLHVQFYISKPDKARWKFSHQPRRYVLCEKCGGTGYTQRKES
jgi:hypothetical protein